MTVPRPPSPDAVLYIVYQRDGDGAHCYEVDDGALVSFWLGHAFRLAGQDYFVALTCRTAARSGLEGDGRMMRPGCVAIGQATFMAARAPGANSDPAAGRWLQLETDGYVGEFGCNDQPDPLDPQRPVLSQATTDGRLLLAVPTRSFFNGSGYLRYALFLFDPLNADSLPFRRWGYLGSVLAGLEEDQGNTAGAGSLAFGPAGGEGLPSLLIPAEPSRTCAPTAAGDPPPLDGLTYTFDAKAGRYLP